MGKFLDWLTGRDVQQERQQDTRRLYDQNRLIGEHGGRTQGMLPHARGATALPSRLSNPEAMARPSPGFAMTTQAPATAEREMMGRDDAPPIQEVIMASSDESVRNTPMEATRVPTGGSSAPTDTSVGRMRMMERQMNTGVPTHFMASLAGQGLSTQEILQRANMLGIPQDAVLRELTKPQYQPQQASFPGTDPRTRTAPMMARRMHNPNLADISPPDAVIGAAPRMAPMSQSIYPEGGMSDMGHEMSGLPIPQASPPAMMASAALRDAASQRTHAMASPIDRGDYMMPPVQRPMVRRPVAPLRTHF